jgi:hypothetical protein
MNTDLIERLSKYIIDNGNGCSDWSGAKDKDGYPLYDYEGRLWRASRLLWTAVYGPISDGLIVRHSCDTESCLVLNHLLLGTHKQNTGDALARGRMIGPRKVTPEVKEQIRELRKTLRVVDIAKQLNISVRSVYSYS